MTARAGLYAFILTVVSAIPALVFMAMDAPWSFLWAILPLLSIILSPFIFGRWIPRHQVRKWLEKYGTECGDREVELMVHLAAHSGLPYTNPEVLSEAFSRSSFYVSRKNVEELLYLQQPEFEDADFRRIIRQLTNRPPVELVRAAMDAGASASDIIRRRNLSGSVTMVAVLESFVEGMPEEYFLAMAGDD